jgi:hypothetical protein
MGSGRCSARRSSTNRRKRRSRVTVGWASRAARARPARWRAPGVVGMLPRPSQVPQKPHVRRSVALPGLFPTARALNVVDSPRSVGVIFHESSAGLREALRGPPWGAACALSLQRPGGRATREHAGRRVPRVRGRRATQPPAAGTGVRGSRARAWDTGATNDASDGYVPRARPR